MGKDMAAYDAPFGFMCYGPVLRVQRYAVNTEPVINFSPGDMVAAGGAVVSTPKGYLMDVLDAINLATAVPVFGAVISVEDEDGAPLQYMKATRVGNGTIAGYLMIADDPDQIYIAQEDGVTNAIDLAEGCMNLDVASETIQAPNLYTGRSQQTLESASAATDVTNTMKIIRPHEDDTPDVDASPYSRWVCQVNKHFYGDNFAGV
jgi:hypothetical protein